MVKYCSMDDYTHGPKAEKRSKLKRLIIPTLFAASVAANIALLFFVYQLKTPTFVGKNDDEIIRNLVELFEQDSSRYSYVIGKVENSLQTSAKNNGGRQTALSEETKASYRQQIVELEAAIDRPGGRTFNNYISAAQLANALNDTEKLKQFIDGAKSLLPAEGSRDRSMAESIIKSYEE
jgi:hypothetical protein